MKNIDVLHNGDRKTAEFWSFFMILVGIGLQSKGKTAIIRKPDGIQKKHRCAGTEITVEREDETFAETGRKP